jgi:hypothetical protein
MSNVDEIKKLKELLDSGAITQDEYDKEKSKLLQADNPNQPVAVPPAPSTPPVSPKIKTGCLAIAIIAITSVIVMLIVTGQNGSNQKGAVNETDFVSKLTPVIELENEKIQKISDLLKECGIAKIKAAKFWGDLDDGGKMYHLDMETLGPLFPFKFEAILALKPDGSVMEINISKSNIQIYADGKIKYGFLTEDEDRKYQVSSQLLVQEKLTSPSSAKFPARREWNIYRNDKTIFVQSYVEAKNAFGVLLKNKFQVQWQNGNPVSLILDGTEYMKRKK